jgi:hypothetical protein
MSEVVEFKFHDDDALNRNMVEQQSMRAAAQGNLGLATDLAHAAALYALASAISGIDPDTLQAFMEVVVQKRRQPCLH